jgi:hypothetical protein
VAKSAKVNVVSGGRFWSRAFEGARTSSAIQLDSFSTATSAAVGTMRADKPSVQGRGEGGGGKKTTSSEKASKSRG